MDSDSAEKAKRRLSLPAKCFTAVRLFADSDSVVLQLGEQCAAQGPLRHTWIFFFFSDLYPICPFVCVSYHGKLLVQQHLLRQHRLVVEEVRLHVAPHVREPPELLDVGEQQVVSQVLLVRS